MWTFVFVHGHSASFVGGRPRMGAVVFVRGHSSLYMRSRFRMCVVVFERTQVSGVMGMDVLWLLRIVVVVVMGRGRRITIVDALWMHWTRCEHVGVIVDGSELGLWWSWPVWLGSLWSWSWWSWPLWL